METCSSENDTRPFYQDCAFCMLGSCEQRRSRKCICGCISPRDLLFMNHLVQAQMASECAKYVFGKELVLYKSMLLQRKCDAAIVIMYDI